MFENELHNRKMKMRHFLSTSSSDTNIVINKKGYNHNIDNNKNEIYEMYNETHKNDTSINKQTAMQILTTSSESEEENKINYDFKNDIKVYPKYLDNCEDIAGGKKKNLKKNLFTISSSDSCISGDDITTGDRDVIKTTLVNLEEQEGNTEENWKNKGNKKKSKIHVLR